MENKVRYSIDHSLSVRYRTLCIQIASPELAEKELYRSLYDDELEWQRRDGKKLPKIQFFRLRPLHSYELCQRLVVTKRLFYKEKLVLGDFFSRLQLEYLAEPVEGGFLVHAFLNNKALSEFDLVLQGSPHVVLKEQMLFFCDPNISWQELSPFCDGPKQFTKQQYELFKKELLDRPLVELEGHMAPEIAALPTLNLVDNTLSFANASLEGREAELLQAGFQKKPMQSSYYYCPTDRSPAAIQQLLDKGWRVVDAQGRELVSLDDCSFSLEKGLKVSGKASFGNDTIDLQPVVKALQQNERLIPLPSGKSGLLNLSKQKELHHFLQEIQLVSGTLQIKKSSIATLSGLSFDSFDERFITGFKPELCQEKEVGKGFAGVLRPYQQQGLNWLWALYENGLNGLLADEMGLGKTVQVLAFLATLNKKALIVVPTSLLEQWKAESHHFIPDKTLLIYHGPNRVAEELERYDIVVTSYGTMRSDLEPLQAIEFGALVVDEAQAIKNSLTLTSQAIVQLKAQFRLSLTGTPVENSLAELESHFRFLEPGLIDARLESLPQIRKKIAPFFLRRKKSDVAKDLPEKIEETVLVTMNDGQRLLYDRFLASLKLGLLKKVQLDGAKMHRMQIFEAILRLRQICCHPLLVPQLVEELAPEATSSGKCDLVLEDLETLLLEQKKVVLFSQFASQLALLAREAGERQWPYLLLDGKTQNRQGLVDTFQNDPSMPLFFISLKAGGVGLNLSKADYVLIYDPWWNRAQEDQAIDRAHRIGRTDVVFSKRYLMKDTIEEKIRLLQEKKSRLAQLLFENGDADLTLDDLTELLAN